MKAFSIIFTALTVFILAACESPDSRIASDKSEREVVAMQSRSFATGDRDQVLRMVVATLSDMGYVVRSIDPDDGSVSSLKGSMEAKAIVGVPKEGRTTVQLDVFALMPDFHRGVLRQVDSPRYYQDFFFNPLAESLGLSALPAT
jgi:hypothetical protein